VIQVRYLRKMINGVPVMATPAEIDTMTAEQLRAVVLAATEQYRTLVVDMTRTRFCDSAAVHALIAARKRVLAKAASWGWSFPQTVPSSAS
jgi:anti-sigma B factor antagonist